jgi:glutamate formiminotransferase/formiminotetrahydrofolate cyclodeaminase
MDTSSTIQNYIDQLSSSSPTPGGGNVSAFCGTLASSLGIMVCNLSFGKKKYLNVEEDLKNMKNELEECKGDFLLLARQDNEAFDQVMEAFRFPKETEEQKAFRSVKIEEATIKAGIVPSRVISLCKKITPILMNIAEKGNQNSLSDAGVALSLISTSAQGAYLNVLINCSSYRNNPEAAQLMAKSESDLLAIMSLSTKGIELIQNKLK